MVEARVRRGAVDALDAHGVDVQEVGEVLVRERLDVAGRQVAGVVDDDVELTRFVEDGPHGVVCRLLRLHIELDDGQAAALTDR